MSGPAYPEYAPTQSADLHQPAADEVAQVLAEALSKNFASAKAEVVDCPDLSVAPFNLAAPGLCGSPRLADIGGVPNLTPVVDRSKVYNLAHVAKEVELPGAFFIGAGAGSHRLAGLNCELMPNTNLAEAHIKTAYAKVGKQGEMVLEHYQSNEFALLANVLACEGKPGKVIKVTCERRTGESNFVTCMRNALSEKYGDKPVGLAGAFNIAKGKAKLHVMPDFSETPLETGEQVEKWLKFYECSGSLICLTVFVSHDPGLQLRVEHTHCFSDHGEGGHYHYDTTPDEVAYEGYFVMAERIYRVDPPPQPAS